MGQVEVIVITTSFEREWLMFRPVAMEKGWNAMKRRHLYLGRRHHVTSHTCIVYLQRYVPTIQKLNQ